MKKRSTSNRSKHNAAVRREAGRLKRQGWDVEADVSGYDKPKPIGAKRRIPDIRATKRGHELLVEVETPKSLKADREQQSTFRRRAGQRRNTKFDIIVTD